MNDTVVIHEITELHRYEMNLLRMMRSRCRFGEITIIMRDGLPQRIKRITEVFDLQKDSI